MADEPNLWVVLGPTASGKSDYALALARRLGAGILSVDSMQVYKGMDIGTAKPTPSEQAQAPHHLIDVVEPDQTFTVARFVELADEVIRQYQKDNRPLVAVGGTPLYYKALFQGLFEGPPQDPAVRARLAQMDNPSLHQLLTKHDPQAASRIHANDTKRLIRALEVHELTGRPISSLQQQWESAPRYQAKWIGMHREKEDLNRRINARVKQMMQQGWLEETKELLNKYGQLSPTAQEATGYQQLINHLQGKISLEDAIEQIKISTRQLARRQMKWFRRFENVEWV